MEQGKKLLEKYAPYLSDLFPEMKASNGSITSPLQEIKNFASNPQYAPPANSGRMFLKRDDALSVAGSIKARGGFFEVLQWAHHLAVQKGFIKDEETLNLLDPVIKENFSDYTIGVASTGNLGLSIGIISARLGFRVNVYMSQDAKEWKKNLLREKGANVVEVSGDFGAAIAKGRAETIKNPTGYFVDDENSMLLFLGYSQAAYELQEQLNAASIQIDEEHPLFVYSPCGVGGSPGGVLWGIKHLYGDAVHSFFVEPTHAPAMLTGLITGEREKICVQDIGLDNHTEADGLAVGRPSSFASSIVHRLVSGIYTLDDSILSSLLKTLYATEGIFIEPSATAGLIGPQKIIASDYLTHHKIDPAKVTHVVWSTGGSLVPNNIRTQLLGI